MTPITFEVTKLHRYGTITGDKSNSKPLIKQILELIPWHILQSSITKHKSDKFCSKYKTYDHLVSQMFGQLDKCQTLTDISTAIGVNTTFTADLGLKQSPARSTMSDGNAKRDWQCLKRCIISCFHIIKASC